MNLKFLGIGGAFNTVQGCNCAFIKEGDKILFIDLGLDSFSKIIKYNLLHEINDVYVVITHTHGDHVGGLPTFIQYCSNIKHIKVKIIDNSIDFTNRLVKFLNFAAVNVFDYTFVKVEQLPFYFGLRLKITTHAPSLECYSIIFTKNGEHVLYTSDSNDIEFVKEKIKDNSFVKIYCDVSCKGNKHINFNDLKHEDKSKLILMHLQDSKLYEEVKKEVFMVPDYFI